MKQFLRHVYNNIKDGKFAKLESGIRNDIPTHKGILNAKEKESLEKHLGLKINNPAYYEEACTHRSYTHVLSKKMGVESLSNERLEFFGDAILEFVVTEYLFHLYTNEFEGELTKMRSNIVSRKSMAICGFELGLHKFLKASFSAQSTLESGKGNVMISDMMEAIIGAIYLDNDMEVVQDFILGKLLPIIFEKDLLQNDNYKGTFMEIVQADGLSTPYYKLLEEIGQSHNKEFTFAAMIDDKEYGRGKGSNKKEAEKEAAKNALENYTKYS